MGVSRQVDGAQKHFLVPGVEFKCKNYEILAVVTVGKTFELGSQLSEFFFFHV